MTSSRGSQAGAHVELYDASYGRMTDRLYADIRTETWGDDLGQTSWLTAGDLDRLLPLLNVDARSKFLDVACGSGGIACRVAERTGASVIGLDLHPAAIAQARQRPATIAMGQRAAFHVTDASRPLAFDDGSFNAVMCVDAINHLPGREAVLKEWRRVLAPSGRILFTDPVVVTGPVENAEIAQRASIGCFVFVPPGENERFLELAGFRLIETRDETEALAAIAARWMEARQRRATDLRRIEGDAAFDGQQSFLRIAALLAKERRLSRFLYVAERP